MRTAEDDSPDPGALLPERKDPLDSGLALSIGSASVPIRILLAVVLLFSAGMILWAASLLAAESLAEAIAAALLIAPLGVMAMVLAIFAMAPGSRFARWLDRGSAPAAWLLALGLAAGAFITILARMYAE